MFVCVGRKRGLLCCLTPGTPAQGKPANADFPPCPGHLCFLYGVHREQTGGHACVLQF